MERSGQGYCKFKKDCMGAFWKGSHVLHMLRHMVPSGHGTWGSRLEMAMP